MYLIYNLCQYELFFFNNIIQHFGNTNLIFILNILDFRFFYVQIRMALRDNNYFEVTLNAIRWHDKTRERCRERGEFCGCLLEHEGIRFPRLSRRITMMLTDACTSLLLPAARRHSASCFFKFCSAVLNRLFLIRH